MPFDRKLSLNSPVQYLKGVGPSRAKLLESRGITTVEDLLYYPPFRYEDRSAVTPVRDLVAGQMATVILSVLTTGLTRTRRGMAIFDLAGSDESGLFHCKWFNAPYLSTDRVFRPGLKAYFYGKVEQNRYGRGNLQMIQPQFEILPEEEASSQPREAGKIVPIYESIGTLNPRLLRRLQSSALGVLGEAIPETLPPSVLGRTELPDRGSSLRLTHFPAKGTSLDELGRFRSAAQQRMAFEEFFFLSVGLAVRRKKTKALSGIGFRVSEKVRTAIKTMLPFHPTSAQKRVLKEIVEDMKVPVPMNRLIQGDVGSGKTIVALQAAILAIESGYQVALMAPTEILATQHYLYTRNLMHRLAYRVGLLISGQKSKEKADFQQRIQAGEVDLIIGTHALIEGKVEFSRLGLVIVDEQHRFGVLQRFRLIRKGASPDVLIMTATPIPRTLALTLYGDLDVSVLDELPPDRVPIRTSLFGEANRPQAFEFIRDRVQRGEQAYVVYPVIEETSRTHLRPAVRMYEQLSKVVFPEFRVALLHGRLPSQEKEAVMAQFRSGEAQVLVATQVIEVGVDVPNATVMLIEHADLFGLSQLHQLRGRIGRGGVQSYCLLAVPECVTEVAQKRLDAITASNDGFTIAEADLALRGPGEFFGTRQWGVPAFRMANILRDQTLLEWAKKEAVQFVEKPGSLEEFKRVMEYLETQWKRRYALSQVA